MTRNKVKMDCKWFDFVYAITLHPSKQSIFLLPADEEEIFKPPPQRCTMFNVAVALFILAAGGLAVVLIIKMSGE